MKDQFTGLPEWGLTLARLHGPAGLPPGPVNQAFGAIRASTVWIESKRAGRTRRFYGDPSGGQIDGLQHEPRTLAYMGPQQPYSNHNQAINGKKRPEDEYVHAIGKIRQLR